jgi:hypothetical protein
MRKHLRQSDGHYHIHGHKFSMLVGSKAQVFHGTAYKTAGGLTKAGIIRSKSSGKFVSKKASHRAKREDRLGKAGWGTIKGEFGAVRLDDKRMTQKKRRRKKRN